MKKMVTGLLTGALATGALVAMAPAAQASPTYATQKECLHAAQVQRDTRINSGDMNVPNPTCVRDGNRWRMASR